MINKTSSIEFRKYGSTYEEHMSIKDNNLICRKLNTSGRIISHMYCFSCPGIYRIDRRNRFYFNW